MREFIKIKAKYCHLTGLRSNYWYAIFCVFTKRLLVYGHKNKRGIHDVIDLPKTWISAWSLK